MSVDVEQIDPFSLPSVALERKDEVPEVSGIYFVLLDSEILYIGRSIDLQQRWQTHHRLKQLKSYSGVILAWFPFTSLGDGDLERLEEAWIDYFKPLLNEHLIPDEFINPNIRVTPETRKDLKMIAAHTGETMLQVVARLAKQELEHLKGQSKD